MKRFRVTSHILAQKRRRHSPAAAPILSLPRLCRRAPGLRVFALLAIAGALAACQYPEPKPQPAPRGKIVLDYRNGWYHKASGAETIAAIAERYKRDPAMVAELNRAGGPYAFPEAGKMLYIPPTSDRDHIRDVLLRLQGHPELIPKTPWDPETAAPAATPVAIPVATPVATPVVTAKKAEPVKIKLDEKRPLAPRDVAQVRVMPVNPPKDLGNGTSIQEEFDPPPPGRKEIVIAAPKPDPKADKKGFFGWLGFGHGKKSASRPVNPAPAPKPQGPPSDVFVWPVKGEVVTAYKGGWHNACHGIEIAAAEGTPVCAARDGRVLLAQDYPGYGNLVLIDHGDGFATAYGYNRQMLVKEGEQVSRGQTIASVGRPTQGSKSKLLFQVRRNALPVDPMDFLKGT